MVKSSIISITKANHLFWLGRYMERVYMTLHLLRKCYDKMIDGSPKDYKNFWKELDPTAAYDSADDFTFGMLYDEGNPCSIISELIRAKDNAILLREDLTTETLSYIEMSVAYMLECKERKEMNIDKLQNITDWAMAFWGSVEQRIENFNELAMLMVGKTVENIDLFIRFKYPFRRISFIYERLVKYGEEVKILIFDEVVAERLSEIFSVYKYAPNIPDKEYSNEVLAEINNLVKV